MTSLHYTLTCPECGNIFDPTIPQTYCHDCISPILAQYDLASLSRTLRREEIALLPRGMWRWRELLPIDNPASMITLGEGDTPLLKTKHLAEKYGIPNLLIKDEALNPTGTFKARGMSAAISRAVELGLREFVIPTAGNAGGALSFYACRANCKAHVYMPADTPLPIQAEVKMSGADLHLVDGLISDAARLAAAEAKERGWFDVSTFKEPFRVEGKKIMGYEIAESLGWQLPDVITYPTGGGTGLVGMWKAFGEMEALGWIGSKRPRMVTVQAAGCAPVVRAFENQSTRVEFWQNATTIAAGLRVPMLFADRLVLRCLRESAGNAICVTDEEIISARTELAQLEGIWASPEGAASLAALKQLVQIGWCKPSDKIVLFNTGSGLKYV